MENLFTMQEYKQFLQHYSTLEKSGKLHDFLEQIEPLCHEYISRLPIYLLARCPICGGRVHEPIDSYSLNGIGWRNPNRGFGWFGPVPVASSQRTSPQSNVSYEAECRHAVIVSVMINLNGIQPDDVSQNIQISSERPFVMSPVLKLEQTCAVIHSLPVGRFDDIEPQHHYTAFFVTYFSNADRHLYNRVMQSAYEGYGLVVADWADYDLLKWVKAGKLYWLDKNDPNLPLYNQSTDEFPYSNVHGGEGIWVIRNGRMEPYYSLNPVHWSGGKWQPELGFLRRLINNFRTDKQSKS